MSVLIFAMGFVVAVLATSGLERWERRFSLLAYCAQMPCSVGQYLLQEHYYGGVTDARLYIHVGRNLARLLEHDFVRFAPEILRVALHLESDLPFQVDGEGLSTGTMSALGGFFVFFFGDSLLNACLASSVVAWLGRLLIYRVARDECVGERRVVLGACLFVPSVVFWSAAFAKEALVMLPLGSLLWGVHRILKRHRAALGVILAVLGAAGVALLKPYILLPLVLATSAWVYGARVWGQATAPRLHPLHLVVPIVLIVGTIGLLGWLFPQFSADQVATTVATQQGYWKQTEGGSTVDVGGEQAGSFIGQLPFLGLGLVNALFRPTIFEARNPPSMAAAFETAALAIALAPILVRSSWSRIIKTVMMSPPLVFCTVFVVSFGMLVGVLSGNLGSLSRYRMPMMPFYVASVLIVRQRLKLTKPSDSASSAPIRISR